MSNRSVCTLCLHGLRQQFAECRLQNQRHLRRLATSSHHFQKDRPISHKTPKPGPAVSQERPVVKQEERRTAAPTLAQKLREKAPSFTETYIAYGACEILVKECSRAADYTILEEQRQQQLIPDAERGIDVGIGKGWWYTELKLIPNFNTWAQITFLHMWLLTVRLRKFPAAHAPAWHQHLTDHFFYMAEDKMATLHGLTSRAVRNRYLKDLFLQWRGLTAGYDQGIYEGDAVLAAAIWRNIFSADEQVDLEKLAMVTSYVRSVLRGLEEIDDEDIAKGEVVFEDPSGERGLVRQKSRLWDQASISVSKQPVGQWTKAT